MIRRRSEQGQALIATIIGISLVLLLLLTAITVTQLSNKVIARRLTYQGQALNAAQAGVVDALSWFRRQPGGAVATFNPQRNLTATPPVDDTEDPTIGIVRTFDISSASHLKGRYEVPIGNAAAGTGVLDITTQVNKTGAGTVWQLESTGYVWVENDSSKAFNQSPNIVLSKQTVRTQIQRLTINLPDGGAAFFAGPSGKIVVGKQARIRGGTSAGLAIAAGAGGSNSIAAGTTFGNPAVNPSSAATNYDIPGVFNVTQQELVGMADIQASTMQDLPSPLPSMSLIVFNGNAAFTQANPLKGSGIFVVLGDLSMTGTTNSYFSGIVFVTGSLTMDQPATISGAVVMAKKGGPTGTATIGNAAGGDIAEVDYDPAMKTQINQQMAQYRFSRPVYWVGK